MNVMNIIEADSALWKWYRAVIIFIPVFVYFFSVFLSGYFDSDNIMIFPFLFVFVYALSFLFIFLYYGVLYLPQVYGIDITNFKVLHRFPHSIDVPGVDICSEAKARIALVRGRCYQVFWICLACFALYAVLLPTVIAFVLIAVYR